MDKMTIFYSKNTGLIKEICGGEQSMSYFGIEETDFNLIYDFIIVEHDLFVMLNIDKMHIIDGEVKMIEPIVPSKYI